MQPVTHNGMRFLLGIPEARWLSLGQVKGPVFLSDERMARRKSLLPRPPTTGGPAPVVLFTDSRSGQQVLEKPAPVEDWARDSSAYTIVNKHGDFVTSVADYAARERRWAADTIGAPIWSAAQDYVCDPKVLSRVGRTVREHQLMTVERYRLLIEIAPEGHWVPVVQGWDLDDYLRHVDDYLAIGVDLSTLSLVGVGSTSGRQAAAEPIYQALYDLGLRLHGFGVSLLGVRLYRWLLASADSMAWSAVARRESIDAGWAANAIEIAELYRDRILAACAGDEYETTARWRAAMMLVRPSRRPRRLTSPRARRAAGAVTDCAALPE